MMLIRHPYKSLPRWISDLDCHRFLLLIPPLLLIFLFFSISSPPPDSLSYLGSFIFTRSLFAANSSFTVFTPPPPKNRTGSGRFVAKLGLDRARIAVCLVGGARRFELTGPSIVERILKVYPNADLFLHCPLDKNAYKLSLLKSAPRISAVRIFEPRYVPETVEEFRVLTAANSPNGIQGLLQYFNLVEGCLKMIQSQQEQQKFTYDWIVRTRVDGYWKAPLSPKNFVPGRYTVPVGSSYGGLNDRLGIGDLNTSMVALSRLSLIPELDLDGHRELNSETAFKAQLTTRLVPFTRRRLPFCVVSDRTYRFPPGRLDVPVAALSSPGPLSGAKCRPCTPICKGQCVGDVMAVLAREWSWTEWRNGTLELCDARRSWEKDWKNIFDSNVGIKLASERRQVEALKFAECVSDFSELKRRASEWDAPPPEKICRMGLAAADERVRG